MKRILIYINSMQPAGGIERVVATLCNKLGVKYQITILVKDEKLSFYKLDNDIQIHSLNNALIFNMKNRISRVFSAIKSTIINRKALRSYLKDHHYDFYYLAHPLQVLEFNLAGADKHKFLISEHGAPMAYNFIYRFIKRILYKRCHAYIVPTKTEAQIYKDQGFPVYYIPHFRSTLPYCLAKKEKNIVLNIGRFTKDKQQIELLEIWRRIIHKHTIVNWKLQLVGNGELEHDLREFVDKHNIAEFVEFLTIKREVERYYMDASLFVLTSRNEGFGMVLLEAISFGLPCISYDCPVGPRDIIQNGVNGYLIDLNNSAHYEKTLVAMLKNTTMIKEMGEKAYQTSQQWTDQVVLEKWYKLLDS